MALLLSLFLLFLDPRRQDWFFYFLVFIRKNRLTRLLLIVIGTFCLAGFIIVRVIVIIVVDFPKGSIREIYDGRIAEVNRNVRNASGNLGMRDGLFDVIFGLLLLAHPFFLYCLSSHQFLHVVIPVTTMELGP